ncbi:MULTISPECIES: hypothetical protein [Pseudomonas]|uniref:hypothetical protein n=1 Tax=Pseudomonas TaxID=286 RepID=UPI0015932D91|nr:MULTISPECIES: hypothetical protein [Pseudomonas]MCX4216410.1 hypothetical protein [Pseudomonas sp. MCal1]UIN54046.1 hypothetical protein LXN51_24380 [Pseudomonas kribbensis]
MFNIDVPSLDSRDSSCSLAAPFSGNQDLLASLHLTRLIDHPMSARHPARQGELH